MNIQEYISSGILEAYALDQLAPGDRVLVEHNLSKFPELKKELSTIEEALEQLCLKGVQVPPSAVKDSLMKKLDTIEPKTIISLSTHSLSTQWKWAMAASVALTLVASYLAYDYRDRWLKTSSALNSMMEQSQKVASDYNRINLQLEKLQSDFLITQNSAFSKVTLQGTSNDPKALASIYWNASTQEVYLSIQNLKQLAQEQQFQLWAIVDGKPTDMGVFDHGIQGLQKMKAVKNPSAFAITIEPRGGKSAPTLETMQVLGTISKS